MCWGRMAYFKGLKQADWVPVRNTTSSSKLALFSHSASAASSMIRISASLSERINADFSNLSAYWPARGANNKRSEEHRLNSSHVAISYAVFCLKKKNN